MSTVWGITNNNMPTQSWDLTSSVTLDSITPATTRGDLIGYTGVTSVRVPVGADGQVLVADSLQPSGLGYTNVVTSVGTGVGLTGGPITSTGSISIANTGVAAGSYNRPNITVNARGQITLASSTTISVFESPQYIQLFKTADQVIPLGVITAITGWTASVNSGGIFTIFGPRVRVFADGIYLIIAKIFVDPMVDDYKRVGMTLNAGLSTSNWSYGFDADDPRGSFTIAEMARLSFNDTIEFNYFYNNNGSGDAIIRQLADLGSGTVWQVIRLGA